MKRTDNEAIEDLMALNAAMEICTEIILIRASDARIRAEAEEIRRKISASRKILAAWWKKARRRKK